MTSVPDFLECPFCFMYWFWYVHPLYPSYWIEEDWIDECLKHTEISGNTQKTMMLLSSPQMASSRRMAKLSWGRGIALEAKIRFPAIDAGLGLLLKENGNEVFAILASRVKEWDVPYDILTFPVKPEFGPKGEPGWKAKAQIELIESSAYSLKHYVDYHNTSKVLMPRPGCGNGGLRWEDVKPVIAPILDDRFTVMERA